MNTESALMAALLSDPGNITLRLAYADYCEENGKPHVAKYLRTIRHHKFVRRMRRWGQLALWPTPQLPLRVGTDRYATKHWTAAPTELTSRCVAVIARFKCGWKLPKHARGLGYDGSAEFLGIYINEWIDVVYPMLRSMRCEVACAQESSTV